MYRFAHSLPKGATKEGLVAVPIAIGRLGNLKRRSRGRVARQRSAKPRTAVRVRPRPQETSIQLLIGRFLFLLPHILPLKSDYGELNQIQ